MRWYLPSLVCRIDSWARLAIGRSDQVSRTIDPSTDPAASMTSCATGPSRSGLPDHASARLSLSTQTTTDESTPGRLTT
jgi:hypothetical protein